MAKTVKSCHQCSGRVFCYGSNHPEIQRNEARMAASSCISPHRGLPTETFSVVGYRRGLSRKNAEKLVLSGCARWASRQTIAAIAEFPTGIVNRLTCEKKQPGELLTIG